MPGTIKYKNNDERIEAIRNYQREYYKKRRETDEEFLKKMKKCKNEYYRRNKEKIKERKKILSETKK